MAESEGLAQLSLEEKNKDVTSTSTSREEEMKINEKNLAAFAKSGNQVDREGYLMKKGEGNKSFTKRWFVLKGNLLFYFERKTDKEPIGVIILEGSTIELTESEMEEHFCFKIGFPSRSYIFGAESQQSMEQWMKSLACASYDYVKLMAAELQRQLDELSRDETIPQKACVSNPFNNAVLNSNVSGGMNTSGPQQQQQQRQPHVPTPPPRHRHAQRNQTRQNQKRTFASLHEEFGAKIMKDQEARWSANSQQHG
jgi:hypothetical protein